MKKSMSNPSSVVRGIVVVMLANMLACGTGFGASSWTITQLTNNDTGERYCWPAISGTNVVWQGWDGSDWEIYSNFAGQLTNNSTDDWVPAISGTNVTWEGWDGSQWQIYSNFAGQLSNDTTDNGYPAISGTNVVWEGWDGHDWEIYSNFGGQLTNNETNDYMPAISGTNVVWMGWDGYDWEIYTNFGGQLTNNSINDWAPAISGTNVVWVVGAHYSGNPFWLGLGINSNFAGQLFDQDTYYRPAISDTNVVWAGWDGSDFEIYMATPPEPPTVEIQRVFDTIYISNPISKSLSFPISALGSPSGGSYKWEIIHHGEGRVQFTSDTTEGALASSVEIQPTKSSFFYEDIEIKVTYTVGSQSDDDSIRIAVVQPDSLSVERSIWFPEPPAPFENGYLLVYLFQVRDHILGRPIQHMMWWDETRKIVGRRSTIKWADLREDYEWDRFISGGWLTDKYGIIEDGVGSPTMLPVGSCVTVEQKIFVEGWYVGTRYQKFYSTWAESVESP